MKILLCVEWVIEDGRVHAVGVTSDPERFTPLA
jgi:hypothetical protein